MAFSDNINYAALTDKTITRDSFTPAQLELAGVAGGRTGGKAMSTLKIVAIVMAVIMVMSATASVLVSGNVVRALMNAVPTLVTLAVIILAVFIVARFTTRGQMMMLKFALDNHLTYTATKTSPPTDPIMFNIGHSRFVTNELDWPNDDLTLADYEYTVGSGKNSRTYRLKYARVKLPRNVPHLLLNAKGNFVNMGIGNYEVKKLKLEGDFDKYFDLCTPPDYQIDALEIFTPDVMAILLDVGRRYDYELVGNYLYIYASKMFDSNNREKQIKEMLQIVDALAPKFDMQVQTYSDERAGNVASGLVAAQGEQLQKRKITRAAVIVIVIVAVWLSWQIFGVVIINFLRR